MAHRGAWQSLARAKRSEAAEHGAGPGSLPRPHAGGPRGRRKRHETRQPSSALRLLPAEAPVICARLLQRLANLPKPRAAPSPPRGCNLRPRPRSPPRPDQSPHLPRPDSPLMSPASRPPCAQWPDRAGHRGGLQSPPLGTAAQPPSNRRREVGPPAPPLEVLLGLEGRGLFAEA